MKNIIFLDIDGVLNYTDWYISPRNSGNLDGKEGDLDPFCIERLEILTKLTNSYIVISSDWRISSDCDARLERAGVKSVIIGYTPVTIFDCRLKDISRGEEIDMWWQSNPYFTNYVILDDRTDMLEHQMKNFVQINSKVGITDFDMIKAIQILKGE